MAVEPSSVMQRRATKFSTAKQQERMVCVAGTTELPWQLWSAYKTVREERNYFVQLPVFGCILLQWPAYISSLTYILTNAVRSKGNR